MANQPIPNDPYRAATPTLPIVPSPVPIRLTTARPGSTMSCRPDPELAEGPASGGRIAMYRGRASP